ncbi:hypothetical protein ABIB57_001106 [Devosia sp. UYZn731]|uniref:hypothetical protein n=1 Tax=Devosia sp. UYZn731 TaxID=3156345 RepID=UPI003390FE6E
MRAVIMVIAATLYAAPALGCDLVPGYTPPTLEELVKPAKTAFFGTVVALRMSNGEITTDLPPECGERDPDAPCWQGFWERLAAYHDNTVTALANVDDALRGTETNQWFELPAGEDNSCGERLYIGQKVLVVDGQVRSYAH